MGRIERRQQQLARARVLGLVVLASLHQWVLVLISAASPSPVVLPTIPATDEHVEHIPLLDMATTDNISQSHLRRPPSYPAH